MDERKEQRVLAMYDVRGIQDYIFRTTKVKDAIGASAIVENIIFDAMEYAVNRYIETGHTCSVELDWYDKGGVKNFDLGDMKDIQVLYIGGGNAFFLFYSRELCKDVNQFMSRFIIESTYSLQLAIAIADYTGNYKKDYENIFREMARTKERMMVSSPVGALPVMDIDPKTGYALSYDTDGKKQTVVGKNASESIKKRRQEKAVRKDLAIADKIFDNYITGKGVDSTIAVVHIDGNNMGLRIRKQIENITDYNKAVNTMRCISYRINHAYKKVFGQMQDYFNNHRKYSVGKILVAGDDITYICNGRIALDTVEYFAKEIVDYTMDGQFIDRKKEGGLESLIPEPEGVETSAYTYEYPLEKETDPDKLITYGFSVCGGVAYIHSHFPFHVGYEVAEACCASAKDKAKMDCYTEMIDGQKRVANWVDFQICKNIQAQNLKEIREKEYFTSHGEKLLLRPYFISTGTDHGLEDKVEDVFTFERFKKAAGFFNGESGMPRTFAKNLRNTYSQGEIQMNLLYSFLRSRNWELPDQEEELYIEIKGDKYAKWYDVLEMLDYSDPVRNVDSARKIREESLS